MFKLNQLQPFKDLYSDYFIQLDGDKKEQNTVLATSYTLYTKVENLMIRLRYFTGVYEGTKYTEGSRCFRFHTKDGETKVLPQALVDGYLRSFIESVNKHNIAHNKIVKIRLCDLDTPIEMLKNIDEFYYYVPSMDKVVNEVVVHDYKLAFTEIETEFLTKPDQTIPQYVFRASPHNTGIGAYKINKPDLDNLLISRFQKPLLPTAFVKLNTIEGYEDVKDKFYYNADSRKLYAKEDDGFTQLKIINYATINKHGCHVGNGDDFRIVYIEDLESKIIRKALIPEAKPETEYQINPFHADVIRLNTIDYFKDIKDCYVLNMTLMKVYMEKEKDGVKTYTPIQDTTGRFYFKTVGYNEHHKKFRTVSLGEITNSVKEYLTKP